MILDVLAFCMALQDVSELRCSGGLLVLMVGWERYAEVHVAKDKQM
jgi:hypothetical protein